MKKIISVLLVITMLFAVAVPAFAADAQTTAYIADDSEKYPVVIVRGMDFAGLYYDCGTESQRPALGEIKADEIILQLFRAIGSGVINRSLDAAMDVVIDYVYDILKGLSMDENGDPLYNVGMPKYPESAENYQFLCEGVANELGMTRACIESLGDGYTYYLNYDWRMDPLVVADEINAMVETAVKTTGKNKVNIACASMGGIMTVGYLTKYGYDRVNRCVFLSSTFCGAQVASDLLCGRVEITAQNLYNFVENAVSDKAIISLLCKVINKVGGFEALTKITDYIVENYRDEVYDRILKPVFGNMLTLWGLTQPEDYQEALDFMLDGGTGNKAFIEKTRKLQNMMKNRDALLKEMTDSGVELAIVAGYDSPVIPVYESADFTGDGVLETYQMSGYATVAKYGETLGDDYVPANPKYLSPDRAVDLSTALFPEYTYIIKGAPHVSCSYGSDYGNFFVWLMTSNGDFYAGANENYPQFMISGSDQSLRPFN